MPQNSNLNAEWKEELGPNWREIQKTYLHTIGNLTLTAYNSEMSDHAFMVKMNMAGGIYCKADGMERRSYQRTGSFASRKS